jgi:hypothetical protein
VYRLPLLRNRSGRFDPSGSLQIFSNPLAFDLRLKVERGGGYEQLN